MTNEELNRRLALFADLGLPYDERLWLKLKSTWEDGYCLGYSHGSRGEEDPSEDYNPYR